MLINMAYKRKKKKKNESEKKAVFKGKNLKAEQEGARIVARRPYDFR